MFEKINPRDYIVSHFDTFVNYQTGAKNWMDFALFIFLPVILAAIHTIYFGLSEGVIGIVVSAASIVAGLLLNLMVLIYTLIVNSSAKPQQPSNLSDFKLLCRETLATIAFSVFLCIILVVGSFFGLAANKIISLIGQFLMVFAGTAALLGLLVILKRSYLLINFEFM